MEFKEMSDVLARVNQSATMPVDEIILNQILALVIKHPLDSDRGLCQDRITELIKQNRGN